MGSGFVIGTCLYSPPPAAPSASPSPEDTWIRCITGAAKAGVIAGKGLLSQVQTVSLSDLAHGLLSLRRPRLGPLEAGPTP